MIHPAVRMSSHVEDQKRTSKRAVAFLAHRNTVVIPMACTITHSAVSDQAMRSFVSMPAGYF